MMVTWIPLLPLLGAALNGLWYLFGQAPRGRKSAPAWLTGGIATIAIGLSFALSMALFLKLMAMPEDARVIQETVFSWMELKGFSLDFTLRIDTLSSLFCLVITGVGTLIHLYSVGYMSKDESPGRYFSYLNLFCFAMLILVLGASLPVLFLGWEGVGLCSYLLIGYWYGDEEKAIAGKKAFVVNRIGDLGFLLGMFLLYYYFGTLDFEGMKTAASAKFEGGMPPMGDAGLITAATLLMFLGCTGKSAQIPLFVWLPDAMAGPTPVSALIHAATMVTSGVYLVARTNFLFTAAPDTLHVMAWVGAATALFAATIAMVQTDIKKVLAYSTVSQLGYMFLACGVGSYVAGVFHVITHAFFKALLFLGAGSVIHGMHHEQDIRKMGGLRSEMPRTYLVFLVGLLAIAGIPPLSGFFSKDEILWSAFSSSHGSIALWGVGFLAALMTAFYMTRLFSLTFLGKSRREHGDHHHEPHESPWSMVGPLFVLAALSVVGGLLGIPHASWIAHWLEPVIPRHAPPEGVNPNMEWILMGVSAAAAALSMFAAFRFFSDPKRAEAAKRKMGGLHKVLLNKWYVDELYDHVLVRPFVALSRALWRGFDVLVIDRVVVGAGKTSMWVGETLRVLQTGSAQAYLAFFALGLALVLGVIVYGLV